MADRSEPLRQAQSGVELRAGVDDDRRDQRSAKSTVKPVLLASLMWAVLSLSVAAWRSVRTCTGSSSCTGMDTPEGELVVDGGGIGVWQR